MCGCVGMTGGGWAHYVGQEKLWSTRRLGEHTLPATGEKGGARQMQGTTWYYFATDQWRYEEIDKTKLKSHLFGKE